MPLHIRHDLRLLVHQANGDQCHHCEDGGQPYQIRCKAGKTQLIKLVGCPLPACCTQNDGHNLQHHLILKSIIVIHKKIIACCNVGSIPTTG